MSRDRLATSLPQPGQDSQNEACMLPGLERLHSTPPRVYTPTII